MEKPNFEKLALGEYGACKENNHEHDCPCSAFEDGCEKIWNDYVVPLLDKVEVRKEFHNEMTDTYTRLLVERDEIIEKMERKIEELEKHLSYYADKNQNQ